MNAETVSVLLFSLMCYRLSSNISIIYILKHILLCLMCDLIGNLLTPMSMRYIFYIVLNYYLSIRCSKLSCLKILTTLFLETMPIFCIVESVPTMKQRSKSISVLPCITNQQYVHSKYGSFADNCSIWRCVVLCYSYICRYILLISSYLSAQYIYNSLGMIGIS